jgi:hypothetical protein
MSKLSMIWLVVRFPLMADRRRLPKKFRFGTCKVAKRKRRREIVAKITSPSPATFRSRGASSVQTALRSDLSGNRAGPSVLSDPTARAASAHALAGAAAIIPRSELALSLQSRPRLVAAIAASRFRTWHVAKGRAPLSPSARIGQPSSDTSRASVHSPSMRCWSCRLEPCQRTCLFNDEHPPAPASGASGGHPASDARPCGLRDVRPACKAHRLVGRFVAARNDVGGARLLEPVSSSRPAPFLSYDDLIELGAYASSRPPRRATPPQQQN